MSTTKPRAVSLARGSVRGDCRSPGSYSDFACDVGVMTAPNMLKVLDAVRELHAPWLESATPPKSSLLIPATKSPLRYPGGKSRAVKQIMELLPPSIDCLCSPFAGGASVELACVARGIQVYAYDAFEPLVNFWQVLLNNSEKLAKLVKTHHPMTKAKFYNLQKEYYTLEDRQQLAAAFFALNRSSFSGTTLSGGMSPGHPRFTKTIINYLASFKVCGFTIEQADFKQSIRRHGDDFLYLDPPYANGGKLYGKRGDCHTDFDHESLAQILRQRSDWLLSYNDCEMIRALYKGFQFLPRKWAYGMNASKKSNEVLILAKNQTHIP